MHVVIMGPMGVGKSTTGRAAAAALGWHYADSDDQIEARHGRTGRDIADERGVPALHDIEAEVLLDALRAPRSTVITAAASTIERPAVRRMLRDDALVIVLEADPAVVIERQRSGGHRRPMSLGELQQLNDRRDPLLREVAGRRLSASEPTDRLADLIVDAVDAACGSMIRFSANLGYLWKDRPLPDAIHAASAAGFDAVECHMPYVHPSDDVATALSDTGLRMISLNTRIGGEPGDFGVAALPGRVAEAQQYIEEAIEYAAAIGCPNVSVIAGRSGRTPAAETTYRSNLTHAADRAAAAGCNVLIEPLNTNVADDYHLVGIDAAVATVEAVGAPNLRIMVDTFHSSLMDGDLDRVFDRAWPHLGHVQISSFPDRNEPDTGSIDFGELLPALLRRGWSGPFGAEYNPRAAVEDGLGWLAAWHQRRR